MSQDVKDILNYLEKIASKPNNAIEEKGYWNDDANHVFSSHSTYAVALSMLFLCSINGVSEGSLDVPSQTGLSLIDHTHTGQYQGIEIVLITMWLVSNAIITTSQCVSDIYETDSNKIYKERQAELLRLKNVISEYVNESSKNGANNIEKAFNIAYRRALHKDVQKRVIDYKNQLINNGSYQIGEDNKWVKDLPMDKEVKAPAVLEAIHYQYDKEYKPLEKLLSAIGFLKSSFDLKSYEAEDKHQALIALLKKTEVKNQVEINDFIKHEITNQAVINVMGTEIKNILTSDTSKEEIRKKIIEKRENAFKNAIDESVYLNQFPDIISESVEDSVNYLLEKQKEFSQQSHKSDLLNELKVKKPEDLKAYINTNENEVIDLLLSEKERELFNYLEQNKIVNKAFENNVVDSKAFENTFKNLFSDKNQLDQYTSRLIYFWMYHQAEENEDFIGLIDTNKLAEALLINPNNEAFIGQSSVYRGVKQFGYGIGWINIAVNFAIGIGAFLGFCAIVMALTGISLLAFLHGWPLVLAILFFAMLSTIMPYLITRVYINKFFEKSAYYFKLWLDLDFKNKLESLWQTLRIRKNWLTLLVTIPSALGLTTIATLAFIISVPNFPFILAITLAAIIAFFTFIACVALFGGMFYDSYDRLADMIGRATNTQLFIPTAVFATIILIIALIILLDPHSKLFIMATFASFMCLALVVAVIFSVIALGIYNKSPAMQTTFATLGLTTAVGQTIAIFCCTAMLLTGPLGMASALTIAGLLALFSFPLFFAWAVMTVALPEDEMEKSVILKQDQTVTQQCSNSIEMKSLLEKESLFNLVDPDESNINDITETTSLKEATN